MLTIVCGTIVSIKLDSCKGYQLKAKTPTQQGSQPERDSADPEAHFIPPYVGSPCKNFKLNNE